MNTLAKLVDDTIHSLEKQNQPQPVRMEVVNEARLLPRQPPPTAGWTEVERQRLATFMGQATRYRKRSLTARLLGWLR